MPVEQADDRSGLPASEASQPAASSQTASFEEGLTALGDLVARLESGSVGLSESIDAYERGVAILRQLHEQLSRAEERVSVLVRIDDEGRPVLAPHDTPATAATSEPAAGRRSSRAKGSRPRSLPGMDEQFPEA